jgi:hypothetical protein
MGEELMTVKPKDMLPLVFFEMPTEEEAEEASREPTKEEMRIRTRASAHLVNDDDWDDEEEAE